MPTVLISLLTMFAKPLGAAINNGLLAASTAFVTWSVSKGVDSSTASTIGAGLVAAASALIQLGASTQGINIKLINADKTNGVSVVKAVDAAAAGIPQVDTPNPAR
jgi:hypothetical protein